MPSDSPELSIVIPAYNESRHLEEVVRNISKILTDSGIEYELCIVNNGSSDDTHAVVNKITDSDRRVRAIELAKNQGYGGGVMAGLQEAKGAVIGWAHADGQIDPHDIVRLYAKMKSEHRELAKVVRVTSYESLVRKFLSRTYYILFQILFMSPYRDMNGTPKIATRSALAKLSLDSKDWFLDPEFVIKALRYKMPITELDTVWHKRKSGNTKARLFFTGLEFFKNMILYRIGVK